MEDLKEKDDLVISSNVEMDGLEDIINTLNDLKLEPVQNLHNKPSLIPRKDKFDEDDKKKETIPRKGFENKDPLKPFDDTITKEIDRQIMLMNEILTKEKEEFEEKIHLLDSIKDITKLVEELNIIMEEDDDVLEDGNVNSKQKYASVISTEEADSNSFPSSVPVSESDEEEDKDVNEEVDDDSFATSSPDVTYDTNKAGLYLGLTCGSLLAGFSLGWFLGNFSSSSVVAVSV